MVAFEMEKTCRGAREGAARHSMEASPENTANLNSPVLKLSDGNKIKNSLGLFCFFSAPGIHLASNMSTTLSVGKEYGLVLAVGLGAIVVVNGYMSFKVGGVSFLRAPLWGLRL